MNTPAQLRLAADILETGHPYEYRPSSCDWLKHDGDVMHHVKMGTPIRPILARPPYEAELHNPDGLTAEQVGVGYRLTVEGESKHPEAEVWAASQWRSTRIFPQWYAVYGTYRLPLSVPWPEQPKPFTLPPMHTFIARPTLDHLNPLRKILPRDWHRFGVEYRSVQTDSAGFCTGGQLYDGRRFTWDNLENRYRFTK